MGSDDFTEAQKKYLETLLKKYSESVCKDIKNELDEVKADFMIYRNKVEELEEENRELKKTIAQIDRKTRRNNLILHGIRADERELEEVAVQTFRECLEVDILGDHITDICRLGRSESSPILVEIKNNKLRRNIFRNAGKLKNTGISISPDYTVEERRNRKLLVEQMKRARERGEDIYIRGNKLVSRTANSNTEKPVNQQATQSVLNPNQPRTLRNRPKEVKK